MDTATQHRLRELLGPEQDNLPYTLSARNSFRTAYFIDVPGARLISGADDVRDALKAAHDASYHQQVPAFVWDWRGEGTDYDPGASPRLVWVVGAFYVGD